jgi:hypothetical protein
MGWMAGDRFFSGVLDWILNLLTTYTHNSEVQATTETLLISTLYSSLQHTLSIFKPAISSQTVPW